MRALPLVVLVTTVAAAVSVRLQHPHATGHADPATGATLLRSSPDAALESLPPSRDVPDASVAAPGAPHMLHGDPQHSHRAHGHIPSRPDVAWTFHADGPVESQVVTSPDEATLYFTTLAGTLWALDLSGHPRFHVPLAARSYGTPCVGADGTVYVGVDGGAFFAIDPRGNVLWKLETQGDADTGAVLEDDGTVVFAAGSRVYGVKPGGVIAFRFQAKGKVFAAPALTRSVPARIVFGSQDHRVYALSARGDLAWSTDLGHDVDGAPAIGDDGGIFVGTDGDEVVRLDDDGHVVWRAPVGGVVRGTLSVARDGDVLAGVYGPSPRLVRVSRSGAILGAFPIRGNGTREAGVHGGALEDDDGALVFGGQDGIVHAIGRDGQERWAYDMHSEMDAPVSLGPSGMVLAASYEGDVVALKALP